MWLKHISSEGTQSARVICFGHAGASHVDFVKWRDLLPSNVEIIAIALPGRCERVKETPVNDIQVLVREIAAALAELPPMPTSFYGHSFGAVLAYETAAFCTKHGLLPELQRVILSASALEKRRILQGVNLTDMDAVLSVFIERQYISEQYAQNKKLMSLVLPYLLADICCKEEWQIDNTIKLAVPIHTVAWDEDALVDPPQVHSWVVRSEVPQLCRQVTLPGAHLAYLNSPAEFIETINEFIAD